MPLPTSSSRKRAVSYVYHPDSGGYQYASNHLMKPHRSRITNELVKAYELDEHMKVIQPPASTIDRVKDFLTAFHADEYIEFLSKVTPDNAYQLLDESIHFNVGCDCPVFDGLLRYCTLYTAASCVGARELTSQNSDIAIHWGGGLHHARRFEASGFCFVNDCVLAILEMLKIYDRVIYVDIDIHHGDGVEEAFYTTDRVMTVSFHHLAKGFFPGSGAITDV